MMDPYPSMMALLPALLQAAVIRHTAHSSQTTALFFQVLSVLMPFTPLRIFNKKGRALCRDDIGPGRHLAAEQLRRTAAVPRPESKRHR